ncbi:MAG: transporter substrate-binding domain-containing protein [Oscillospiraceae bacterium]|nr:transporter substrate-binding domain-containing protein [Oscillospiraceae bacterium]
MLPMSAHAQNTARTVRVGWYESPFNQTDEFGRRSGYAYEYQQKIAAYTGWHYEYVEGSWPELLQMLIDGEIDLMSDVSYTDERSEFMLFSELPMGEEEYFVFVAPNSESGISAEELSSFNGKRIGINKSSVQEAMFLDWAAKKDIQVEVTELTVDEDESVAMLKRGELDAFVSIHTAGRYHNIMPVCKIGSSEFFFAVNKARPELLSELDLALSRIQEDNFYYVKELYNKYIGYSGTELFLTPNELSWLAEHGPIRVGYRDDYLAFCAQDPDTGELTGALKDFLELASHSAENAEIEFTAVPVSSPADSLDMLMSGEVDCLFPTNVSEYDGEELHLSLTVPLMQTGVVAVVRQSAQREFSLQGEVTVAVNEGNPDYETFLMDCFPEWNRLYFKDTEACLSAVADGKADCVLVSDFRVNRFAATLEKYRLTTVATGEILNLSFAMRHEDTPLYAILNKVINLVPSSSVNASLASWSYTEQTMTFEDFVRQNPAIVIAVAVAILALILIIILQHQFIVARREADESRHKVEDLNKQVFVDTLTHVKNKSAYEQWEERINTGIRNGEREPFAVVVCDINDLKTVNDQYGHNEGDACIINACAKICSVFSHSPVFRIGGDEFVVILSGEDYLQRKRLMEQINAVPRDRSKIRAGETVAAGMAEYRKDQHASLLSVFEDADKTMYERKQLLKKSVLQEDQQTDGVQDPEYIPVIHARKTILIVDDQEMNREIMGDLLEDDYDIVYVADGIEALKVLRSHKDEIDLVLLDLLMPNKNGKEVLAEMQVDEDLRSIPVIVLTVDQDSELDCLKTGAMDFIPKPYPDIEIVKARISKCIELSEDRELIRYTERDKLTGLLNKDYFFRYVSRLDHMYKNIALDAVVCDVSRFHSVNKQYGRQFGDRILRSIGNGLKKLARETGGIVCREAGDTFLLYCPHQGNYEQLFREYLSELFDEKETAEAINVRFGVFADARQEPDIEERFDRAKIAADRVRNDPEKICGFYELN